MRNRCGQRPDGFMQHFQRFEHVVREGVEGDEYACVEVPAAKRRVLLCSLLPRNHQPCFHLQGASVGGPHIPALLRWRGKGAVVSPRN